MPVCPTGASYKRKRGRHRPGRLRQVHRLQVLRLGLPVRRARDRRSAPGDDQVHALRRPHPRRSSCRREDRKPACVKACPTGRAPVRRRQGSGLGGLARDPRARRLSADARVADRSPANQYLPRRDHRACRRRTAADARARQPARQSMRPADGAATMNPALLGRRLHDRSPARRRASSSRSRSPLLGGAADRRRRFSRGARRRRRSLLRGRPRRHRSSTSAGPQRAWRAAAMWRTSWLSREVIVLPAFIALVALWWLALRDRAPPVGRCCAAAARGARRSPRCSGTARR